MNQQMTSDSMTNDKKIYDVIIIGSGPAGLTAAIYTSRANLKTLIVAGDNWGGQLMLTTEVENYPGFEDGIMGPELMEKMKKQALRFGAEWVDKSVTEVELKESPFKVKIGEDQQMARSVIVATGAKAVWLGVPGEDKLIGRGISSCAPCDAAFFRNKRVMVVGGGDSAMEEALVLTKFASEVTIVHRRDAFRASQIMIDRVMQHPKVKVFWDTEVVKVEGDQRLEGVVLKTKASRWASDKDLMLKRGQGQEADNSKLQMTESNSARANDKPMTDDSMTNDEFVAWEAKIDGMFVAVGHKPITDLFRDQLEVDEKGYLIKKSNIKNQISKIERYTMMTSKEGVFVAGDVHDLHYKQAVTAAGFGCMAALEVEKWLEDKS